MAKYNVEHNGTVVAVTVPGRQSVDAQANAACDGARLLMGWGEIGSHHIFYRREQNRSYVWAVTSGDQCKEFLVSVRK